MTQKVTINYDRPLTPDATAVKFRDHYSADEVLNFIAASGVKCQVQYEFRENGTVSEVKFRTHAEAVWTTLWPGNWLVLDHRNSTFSTTTWDIGIKPHNWSNA